MKQVFKSGAVAAAPDSSGALSEGNPTEGDQNTAATVIGDYWFHGWGKEGEAVIEAGRDSNGDPMVPDKDTLTQMRDAIQSMIDRAAPKGGLTGPVDSENANFNITADDDGKTFEVDATAGARTANLPDLGADDDGYTVTVTKVDNSVNTVTADGHGTDTINGAATYVLKSQYESVILKWTGSSWLVIGGASTDWVRSYVDESAGMKILASHTVGFDFYLGQSPYYRYLNLSDDPVNYSALELLYRWKSTASGGTLRGTDSVKVLPGKGLIDNGGNFSAAGSWKIEVPGHIGNTSFKTVLTDGQPQLRLYTGTASNRIWFHGLIGYKF